LPARTAGPHRTRSRFARITGTINPRSRLGQPSTPDRDFGSQKPAHEIMPALTRRLKTSYSAAFPASDSRTDPQSLLELRTVEGPEAKDWERWTRVATWRSSRSWESAVGGPTP